MQNDRWFRIFAVLFALLAVSNLSKPLGLSAEAGLVFFGERLDGVRNMILAPLFAIYLGAYAYGLWMKKRFALYLGVVYALYVPINLWLFNVRSPELANQSLLFGLVYSAVAIGVSWGAAILLVSRRDELG